MENKYYTPKISELFVGYECEFASNPLSFELNNYDRIQVGELSMVEFRDIINWYQGGLLDYNDLNGVVRTPYLTKEQIENGGWKLIKEKNLSNDKSVLKFKKDNNILYQGYLEDHTVVRELIQIWNSEKENHCIFEGRCSSINEFKIICKLLGIK